jgi:hypothetical protein
VNTKISRTINDDGQDPSASMANHGARYPLHSHIGWNAGNTPMYPTHHGKLLVRSKNQACFASLVSSWS